MKITCVILHYNTINDTEMCIDSILKLKDKSSKYDIDIVVVDNNSKNGSGKILQGKYDKQKDIYVILNSENLGFSAGNNIGFKFAKENLKSDFIILFNNDTYIFSENFFEEILTSYNEKKWAVMGPKIILKDDTVNPINLKEVTKERVQLEIKYYEKIILLNKLHLYSIYTFLKNFKQKLNSKKENKIDTDKEYYNILLHGCCLIFSPEYIKMFDGLEEKTFLYCEEEFLFLRLKNNNLTNYYNPKLVIKHMEYSATKTVKKFNLYRSKNLLEASEILLKSLEQ